MASTKVELVRILEEILDSSDAVDHALVQSIIDKAREGYYHDFETTIAYPKAQLCIDLKLAGLPEIGARVMTGEFDE